jgi:molybdopterin converting factor small subunit
MATIKFTYALKRFYPKLDTLELPAKNVNTVVHALDDTYPGIKDYLIDEQGQLRKHVNIFVDGDLIQDRTTLQDTLKEDSEVYIMQALSGG